jgi:replicative DNA helicase
MIETKQLCFNEEVEKGFLSSLCHDQKGALEKYAELPVEIFYLPNNQAMYAAMQKLFKSSVPVSFPVIIDTLKQAGTFEEAGERQGVNEMWEYMLYAPPVPDYYFKRLHDLYQCRGAQLDVEHLRDDLGQITGELHNEYFPKFMERIKARMEPHLVRPVQKLGAIMIEATDFLSEEVKQAPIGFGIPTLDAEIFGVGKKEVCIVAAESGWGKSALAAQAAIHCCQVLRRGAVFFSLEMPALYVALRMAACAGRISMTSIWSRRMTELEQRRFVAIRSEMESWGLYIEDDYKLDVGLIEERARAIKESDSTIDLIVVDYLQLVSGDKCESRQQEVAGVSKRLRSLAKELDVAVIAISQLNDDGKLRESRAIGQDADKILRIIDSETDEEGSREIEVNKNRTGKAGAKIPVLFYGQYMTFQQNERLL